MDATKQGSGSGAADGDADGAPPPPACCALARALRELWLEGVLCDVELESSDGAVVRAHRAVLAASSPFFRALWAGSGAHMREGRAEAEAGGGAPPRVRLPGVGGAALALLVGRLYGAPAAAVGPDTVGPLLGAASYLSAEGVAAECASWLRRQLSVETAAPALALSERYGQPGLRAEVVAFLKAHVGALAALGRSAGFSPAARSALGALPAEALLEVVAADDADVPDEAAVVDLAARWAYCQAAAAANRAPSPPPGGAAGAARAEPDAAWVAALDGAALDAVAALVGAARLPPGFDLRRALAGSAPGALALAAPLEARAAAAARAPGGGAPAPRCAAAARLMAAGGEDGSWRALPAVEFYDPRLDAWAAGPALPRPAAFAAGTVLGGEAWVVDAAAGFCSAYARRRDRDGWACAGAAGGGGWALARAGAAGGLSARTNAAVAALAGGAYVAGGRARGAALASVLRLAPPPPHGDGGGGGAPWPGAAAPAAPMRAPRAALALAALGGRLYAVGGQGNGGAAAVHDTVEVYDPEADRWDALPGARLAQGRKYAGLAAGAGGRLVAVGGLSGARVRLASAEGLDPREGRWRALPPLPGGPRSSAGVAALGGDVYVVGGAADAAGRPGERAVAAAAAALDARAGRWRECAPLPGGPRAGLCLLAV